MEKRIKLIIEGQDQASAAILSAGGNAKSMFGSLGATANSILPSFLAWQAIRGVFHEVGDAVGMVTGAIADTAKVGMEFNAQMSKVGAVSGATGEQFDALRLKAQQLGRDTVFTTNEAGIAMEELVKAGISIPDILNGAADSALNLASAGSLSLEESATIIARAMNTFHIGAEQSSMAADILANAANASATDVHNLSQAIKFVGPAMDMLTNSSYTGAAAFRDTATAVAILSNNGIDAGMAGAGLQRVLESLKPTSDKATDAFKDLGLIVGDKNKFFDAQGNFIGLKGAVDVLHDAMHGLSDEDVLEKIHIMFGQRGGRVITALMNHADAWDDMWNEVGDPGGAAETAKKKLDNLAGAVEYFRGSIEYLQTSIWSEAIEKALAGGITRVSKLINDLGDAARNPAAQRFFTTIADILSNQLTHAVDVIQPKIMTFVHQLGTPETMKSLSNLQTAIALLIDTIFGSSSTDIDPEMTGPVKYNERWKLSDPDYVASSHHEVAHAIDDLATAITDVAKVIKVLDDAGKTLDRWQTNIQKTGDNMRIEFGRWVYNTSHSLNNDLINAVTSFENWPGWADIASIPQRIKDSWSRTWAGIQQWFYGLFGAPVQSSIQQTDHELTGTAAGIPGHMIAAWSPGLSRAVQVAITLIGELPSWLGKQNWSGVAKAAAGTLIDGVVSGINAGIGAAKSAAASVATAAVDVWRSIWKSRSPSQVFYDIGYSAPQGAANGIVSGIPDVSAAATKAAQAATNSYQDTVKASQDATYAVGNQTGERLVDGAADGVDNSKDKYNDAVVKMLQEIEKTLTDMLSRITGDFANAGKAAGDAWSGAAQANMKAPTPPRLPDWGNSPQSPPDYPGPGQAGGSAPSHGSRDDLPAPWDIRPGQTPGVPVPNTPHYTTLNVHGLAFPEAVRRVADAVQQTTGASNALSTTYGI